LSRGPGEWSNRGPRGDLNGILDQLKQERDRLTRAIEALEGVNRTGPGRAAGTSLASRSRKRRKMSAEARAKIAAAQRARCAKVKKAKAR